MRGFMIYLAVCISFSMALLWLLALAQAHNDKFRKETAAIKAGRQKILDYAEGKISGTEATSEEAFDTISADVRRVVGDLAVLRKME